MMMQGPDTGHFTSVWPTQAEARSMIDTKVRCIAFVLLLAEASAVAGEPQRPATRAEFAAAMARIKTGMPKEEVVALLGPPDDIRTNLDPGEYDWDDTREFWCWGTDGHLSFPTLGEIMMYERSRVADVWGERGTPEDPPAVWGGGGARPVRRCSTNNNSPPCCARSTD